MASNILSRWIAISIPGQSFNNRYWPAHYLIDRNGMVVYTHFGEGDYNITENNIRYLLGLKDKAAPVAADDVTSASETPETYVGYGRAKNYKGERMQSRRTRKRITSSPNSCLSMAGR